MPNKICAICNGQVSQSGRGRPRLYCSVNCKRKASASMRRPNCEPWMPKARPCATCGQNFLPFSSRNKFCSAVCREVQYGSRHKLAAHYERSCQNCQSTFSTHYSRKRFCSTKCRQEMGNKRKRASYFDEGVEGRCFVYFRKCLDCGIDICIKRPSNGFCLVCIKARRSWHDARKNHKRRGAGPIEVSRNDLIRLRGKRCHICRKVIDLKLSGMHPMGFTIDHLLPVSKGGTNDLSNLDVAHRQCNIARGNCGDVQLPLDVRCERASS